MSIIFARITKIEVLKPCIVRTSVLQWRYCNYMIGVIQIGKWNSGHKLDRMSTTLIGAEDFNLIYFNSVCLDMIISLNVIILSDFKKGDIFGNAFGGRIFLYSQAPNGQWSSCQWHLYLIFIIECFCLKMTFCLLAKIVCI